MKKRLVSPDIREAMMLLFFLFLSTFLLAGCQQSVKYVCSDGSVVTDASQCPPAEEVESSITPSEVISTDVFTMRGDESIDFEGKNVKLVEVLSDGKTLVEVSGVQREIKSTKQLEIINGLEIVVQSISYVFTDPASSSATLKINTLVLGEDEYLFYVDRPQVVEDVEVTLSGVTSSYILVGTEQVPGMKIYPGSSKVVSGLSITNLKAFPRGVRAEDYAILKIAEA